MHYDGLNPLERIMKEIRRRTRVVGAFAVFLWGIRLVQGQVSDEAYGTKVSLKVG